MLAEPRVSVLVEVYILGLPCADSLLVLTLRGKSVGVEVVLDLWFLTFLLLVLSLNSNLSGQCDGLRNAAK